MTQIARSQVTRAALQNSLQTFFFAPLDAFYAGVFRIALASMAALVFWPHHTTFLGGFLPYYWFFVLGVLAVFGVGYRSRLVNVVLLFLLAPLATDGTGSVSRPILLFALLAFCFVPSDRRLSVSAKTNSSDEAGPMWPLRLIQLLLCVIYGINALAKATPHYLSGEVLIAMSQMLPNFLVDLSSGFYQLGLVAIPMWILAVFSVLAEAFLAVAFWAKRWRWAVAAFGVIFHLILKLFIDIHLLDWTCIFLYLTFLLPFEKMKSDKEKTPEHESSGVLNRGSKFSSLSSLERS